jgi:serine/threonine-protein kinase
LSVPLDNGLGDGRASRTAFAISPDGRAVVFSAVVGDRQQLLVRALDQLEATPLPGTEEGHSPFFSPDGQWVGFQSKGLLQKVPLTGGAPPTAISPAPPLFGAAWGVQNTIVFAVEKGGLWTVPAGGGTPKALTTIDPAKNEYSHRLPQFLPDGQTVLFTITRIYLPRWDQVDLAVRSPSGEQRILGPGADARYVSSGHLLFMRSGTLVAAPFDVTKAEIVGDVVTMVGGVEQAANMSNRDVDTGAGQFSVSDAGSLVYLPGGLFPDRESEVMSVSRRGEAQALPLPPRAYLSPLLSPDGSRLVVWAQGLDRNVWTFDLVRNTLTRLTTEGRNHRGIWTRDGQRVTYAGSATNGSYNLFWVNADGSGAPEQLTTGERAHTPSSWSPDGTLVFLEDSETPDRYDVLTITRDDRKPRPILQARSRAVITYPEFSPDGKWLAYVSAESGRSEVYVEPYPGPGPRKQISDQGGSAPAWSRNGRELFYIAGATPGVRMMAVPITLSPGLVAGTPETLFEGAYRTQVLTRGYDVSADGQRFFMTKPKARPAGHATQMILVQNWVDELKRRVPAR